MNWTIRIFLAVVTLAILGTGCKRIESIPNGKPRTGSANAAGVPAEALVLDVTGQAITGRNLSADDRIRTTAILDALRKFAVKIKEDENSPSSGDTAIAKGNIDGMDISGVTISRNGVILLDSVVVTLVKVTGDSQKLYRWKSFNMELAEPTPLQALNFDELVSGLRARGIEVKAGMPVGNGLWQESLAVRRWANQ